MVLDKECKIDFEEHMATMLQNKAMIQNNVLHKRKKQLEHWEHSELNQICPKRNSSYHSKVKFQNRDIFLSACQSGDEDEVEELLNKGSDINSSTIDGVTALHQAVIDGNMDIVRFLVQHNADINAQDNEGWTPLHAAVCCGNLNIAKYLYENNADLACVNSDRELPVDLAESDEMRNYLEEVMRLKNIDERKARETEFNTMLEDCRSLINSGKPLDTPHPKTGATALHVAASRGYIKIIEMLINAGADVNAPDFEGWTPLHAADHWGERDACRILEENGAKFEASDIDQKIQRLVESQVEDTEKTHYNCRQQSKEDYTSNGSNNSSDDSLHKDASKQFAEMKLKHQDMEREKTALEGAFERSEVQLKSFKTIAEQSEKVPEELQKQNRQLKKESTPESAPLVQSARLFWNSIENNGVNSIQNQLGQQNHPIVTTQLHQQQFLRSRQKFALANQCSVESSGNSSSSVSSLTNNTSQSPFAFVAGEQQKQPFTTKPSSHIFKRAESLKVVGSNFNNSNNNGVNAIYINSNIQQQPQQQQTIPPQQQQFMLWRQQTVTSKDLLKDPKERKNFVKTTRIVLPPPPKNTKEDLNKNKPLLPLTAAFTSSISNNVEGTTTPPSESCSSSIAASPSSLSPLVNFPFVTVRKQSLIQTTPPTQPTSQKESESERKAKSKLKRSTRRSTQGVTLEQLGEAAGRHSGSHNNNGNHHQPNHGDRVQRANEKFNCFMEVTKDNKEIHEELKFLKKTVQDLQNQQYHLKNEILWRDKLIHENGFVVVNQDPNDDFLQSLHHRNISENGNDSTKNKFEPLLLSYVTLAAVEKALPGTSAVDQKIQRINRKLRQKVEEAEKTLYNCRQQSQEDYTSNGSNSSNDDSLHKDASKQFAEMKLKLQEMEREKTALEGAFGRSETQLKRFKTIAEQSEKESEELQKQNRQLKKELRDKEQSLEESKETINQLQSRLEKMRNTKRPI